MRLFSNKAWLPEGWVRNVRISADGTGVINRIEPEVTPQAGDVCVDVIVPALSNLHSHGFQRAMAGMTEVRAAGQDSFWTWRAQMYRFLEHLTPEDVQAITALAYMEMLEAGFTSVGEFHYVHHQSGGHPYETPAELSLRVMEAATLTGIGLTHLPVLYSYGGAHQKPLNTDQARFGHTVDSFLSLMDDLDRAISCAQPDSVLGIAPHSLRATSPDDLSHLVSRFSDRPIHIHVAEQPREVDEIVDWLGARPVEWLLNLHDVRDNWCLIHATHMTDEETRQLARSGAVAGLCPITEANLGDGPFNGPIYLSEMGAFGVGSDSNVRISAFEELRLLEYSQRLRDMRRNVLVSEAETSVGKTLYLGAARGGAQALGRKSGDIREGYWADILAVDSAQAALCALDNRQFFDGLCFAADNSVITDVWSAGRHMVADGTHVRRETITKNFRQTMDDLRLRLAA